MSPSAPRRYSLCDVHDLPPSSLVPFDAPRLSNPSVLWKSSSATSLDPLRFAYCRRCDGESAIDFSDTKKAVFLAERYGGAGLSDNGGGVRCGLLEGIQVKGSGRNPLAGAGTDYWHKHGASSVQDAMKEAFWGEVLEHALPYGAARGLSIVSTGTRFSTETTAADDKKVPSSARRALLLREPVLRPAHFMRAIFFRPESGFPEFVDDAERTRRAISSLPTALRPLLSPAVKQSELVGVGLREVFRRAAVQLAFARAKRLHHGSLTPSNFAMDGRWLDFGTMTGLGTYRRVTTAPGALDFWSAEVGQLEAAYDLAFYTSKFASGAGRSHEQIAAEIAQGYKDGMAFGERRAFLGLLGLSSPMYDALPEGLRSDCWDVLQRFLHAERGTPALYYGDDRHPMPSSAAAPGLTLCLRACALSATPDGLLQALRHLRLRLDLAEALARTYWAIRRHVCEDTRANPCREVAFAIRGLRLNGDLHGLYRRRLDGWIDDQSKQADEALGGALNAATAEWKAVLGSGDDVALDPWFTTLQGVSIVALDVQERGASLGLQGLRQLVASARVTSDERLALTRLMEGTQL